MSSYPDYIFNSIKEWQQEILEEIKVIEQEIDEKAKKIEINNIKMEIIGVSMRSLGNERLEEEHWKLYGKPLEEENDRIREELGTVDFGRLKQKKQSLNHINHSITKFIRLNE